LRQIYAPALDGIGFEAIEKSDQMADRKHAAMAEFRQRYADLKASWGGYNGYDAWVARANNATFGVQAAYDELVPAFEALFVRHGCRFPAFYDAVQTLAVQPAQARHQALRQHLLAASSPATHPHTCHG
jgi:predicted aminopeptidase